MLSKNISVIGLGYVGVVSSACLASMGHKIIGVEISEEKVEAINRGEAPIHEPGLAEILNAQVKEGNLRATSDLEAAIMASEISLICVGTPTTEFGEVNLDYVFTVVRAVARAIHVKQKKHIVVMRSTVPPGTGDKHIIPLAMNILKANEQTFFHYVSNPEFLREGSAIQDFMQPPETVIGGLDKDAMAEVGEIYQGIDAPLLECPLAVAEMLKYVNNTWHALKVAFANEVGSLAKQLNVDGQDVMDIFCEDKKLNLSSYYMRPGFAFGGSCLPKDVRGLTGLGRRLNLELPLMNAILPSNDAHIDRAIEMIQGPGISEIGILGISFKCDTDDIRESPMVTLAKRLWKKGYKLRIYDENVCESILSRASSESLIHQLDEVCECLCDDFDYVLEHSQVLVIGNGNKKFSQLVSQVSDNVKVVDLARIGRQPSMQNYQGIGW